MQKAPKDENQKLTLNKGQKVKKTKGSKVKAIAPKEISFVPKEYLKAQKIRTYINLTLLLVLVETFVFVLAFVIPPQLQISKVEKEVAEIQLQSKDSKFDEVISLQEELKETKEQNTQWTDAYNMLNADTFITTSVLDSLIARMPTGMSISQLVLDGDTESIKIDGTAQTKPQVLNYVMLLQQIYGEMQTTFQLTDVENATTQTTEVGYSITIDMAQSVVEDETDGTSSTNKNVTVGGN